MSSLTIISSFIMSIFMAACMFFIYAFVTGDPNPLLTTVCLTAATVFSVIALAIIVVYGPPLVVLVRGVRGEFEDWVCLGDWRTAFSSRAQIRRTETLNLVQHAHPNVPDDLHDWFGEDARRVFRAIAQAADFKGGKYRITAWLEAIRDADIRDFDTLIGYIEVAGVEPAVYAMQENMPIEYARSLFVVS